MDGQFDVNERARLTLSQHVDRLDTKFLPNTFYLNVKDAFKTECDSDVIVDSNSTLDSLRDRFLNQLDKCISSSRYNLDPPTNDSPLSPWASIHTGELATHTSIRGKQLHASAFESKHRLHSKTPELHEYELGQVAIPRCCAQCGKDLEMSLQKEKRSTTIIFQANNRSSLEQIVFPIVRTFCNSTFEGEEQKCQIRHNSVQAGRKPHANKTSKQTQTDTEILQLKQNLEEGQRTSKQETPADSSTQSSSQLFVQDLRKGFGTTADRSREPRSKAGDELRQKSPTYLTCTESEMISTVRSTRPRNPTLRDGRFGPVSGLPIRLLKAQALLEQAQVYMSSRAIESQITKNNSAFESVRQHCDQSYIPVSSARPRGRQDQDSRGQGVIAFPSAIFSSDHLPSQCPPSNTSPSSTSSTLLSNSPPSSAHPLATMQSSSPESRPPSGTQQVKNSSADRATVASLRRSYDRRERTSLPPEDNESIILERRLPAGSSPGGIMPGRACRVLSFDADEPKKEAEADTPAELVGGDEEMKANRTDTSISDDCASLRNTISNYSPTHTHLRTDGISMLDEAPQNQLERMEARLDGKAVRDHVDSVRTEGGKGEQVHNVIAVLSTSPLSPPSALSSALKAKTIGHMTDIVNKSISPTEADPQTLLQHTAPSTSMNFAELCDSEPRYVAQQSYVVDCHPPLAAGFRRTVSCPPRQTIISASQGMVPDCGREVSDSCSLGMFARPMAAQQARPKCNEIEALSLALNIVHSAGDSGLRASEIAYSFDTLGTSHHGPTQGNLMESWNSGPSLFLDHKGTGSSQIDGGVTVARLSSKSRADHVRSAGDAEGHSCGQQAADLELGLAALEARLHKCEAKRRAQKEEIVSLKWQLVQERSRSSHSRDGGSISRDEYMRA